MSIKTIILLLSHKVQINLNKFNTIPMAMGYLVIFISFSW